MEFSISSPDRVKKKKKRIEEVTEAPVKKRKNLDEEVTPSKSKKSKKDKAKLKQKLADEEYAKPKKKVKEEKKVKKKPKLELTIDPKEFDDPKKQKRLSRIQNKLDSILQDTGDDIQSLLEENDSDNATSLINKRLLQTLIDLIPYAEHNIRKTEGAKGVYQLTSLIQSIQETMTAVQAQADRGAMGSSLVSQVIQPAFLEMTTKIVNEYVTLESELRTIIPDNKRQALSKILSPSRLRIASFLQDQFKGIRSDVIGFMER